MRKVWLAADSIISPLGKGSLENYEMVRAGRSGVELVNDPSLSATPVFAAKIKNPSLRDGMSLLESVTFEAIDDVLSAAQPTLKNTMLILSTTKGNISQLGAPQGDHSRVDMHRLGKFIADAYGFSRHLVVSNACISGVMSLIVGKRMIQSGVVDHVLVAGVDVLSKFVLSGFQSLQALSAEPCRPFDADRKGINLGDCAAAVLLTGNPSALKVTSDVLIAGGGLSNDANHISGPSRTGEELAFAIQQASREAGITSDDIDMICAHGTATVYNDEMEARAFNLGNLADVPVNSLKGYYGHTLGAAGVLEVAITAESLRRNEVLASHGFNQLGVSQPLNVAPSVKERTLNTVLKTASGFGGCNAALILKKDN